MATWLNHLRLWQLAVCANCRRRGVNTTTGATIVPAVTRPFVALGTFKDDDRNSRVVGGVGGGDARRAGGDRRSPRPGPSQGYPPPPPPPTPIYRPTLSIPLQRPLASIVAATAAPLSPTSPRPDSPVTKNQTFAARVAASAPIRTSPPTLPSAAPSTPKAESPPVEPAPTPAPAQPPQPQQPPKRAAWVPPPPAPGKMYTSLPPSHKWRSANDVDDTDQHLVAVAEGGQL
ncbi:hypothetical protein HK104_007675, partial [Borealophlyctis nickersoniae]